MCRILAILIVVGLAVPVARAQFLGGGSDGYASVRLENLTFPVVINVFNGGDGDGYDSFFIANDSFPTALPGLYSGGVGDGWSGYTCLFGTACDPVVLLDLKVWLEGAYADSSMNTASGFTAALPMQQPYDSTLFDGTELNYDSLESVVSIPDSVIDWVVVSLRTSTDLASAIAVRSGFLIWNGRIVDLDGKSRLAFHDVTNDSLNVVVAHRNHMSVMSSSRVDLTDGVGSWDFTSSLGQSYTLGPAQIKSFGDGNYGMFACDINADGMSTASDFNQWLLATKSVQTGYLQEDCNLDGQVTAADFNVWLTNTKAAASSQVVR